MTMRIRVLAALSAVAVVTAAGLVSADYLYDHRYAVAGINRVTLTGPQAVARADAILITTVNAATPQLTWWLDTPTVQPTLSGWTGQPDGTGKVDDDANIMTEVSTGKQCALLTTLAKALMREGYTVADPSSDCSGQTIYANASDGTSVTISEADATAEPGGFKAFQVSVTVGNIAVSDDWDSQTVPGKIEPSQPSASTGGLEAPPSNGSNVPDVDDPYWSH